MFDKTYFFLSLSFRLVYKYVSYFFWLNCIVQYIKLFLISFGEKKKTWLFAMQQGQQITTKRRDNNKN